jgi:hypothetical protein
LSQDGPPQTSRKISGADWNLCALEDCFQIRRGPSVRGCGWRTPGSATSNIEIARLAGRRRKFSRNVVTRYMPQPCSRRVECNAPRCRRTRDPCKNARGIGGCCLLGFRDGGSKLKLAHVECCRACRLRCTRHVHCPDLASTRRSGLVLLEGTLECQVQAPRSYNVSSAMAHNETCCTACGAAHTDTCVHMAESENTVAASPPPRCQLHMDGSRFKFCDLRCNNGGYPHTLQKDIVSP